MSEPTASETTAPSAPKPGMPLRWTYAILILAFLFVLMPFLFWRQTWFGAPLSDEEIAKNFADVQHPRKIQHALVQVERRIREGDPTASRWYPQVLEQVDSKTHELRMTAAWVMGQDNSVSDFHTALLRLLQDPHPMVRRNAALALVRFQDAAGHGEVIALLQPFELAAPAAGTLAHRLQSGDAVNPGTLLGRIRSGDNEVEIRSEVPGTLGRWLVNDGASVTEGQGIASLAPDHAAVWEGLRALALIGLAEDLPLVEGFSNRFSNLPEAIQQQARETARAIRERAAVSE